MWQRHISIIEERTISTPRMSQLMQSWSATEFVFLSEECFGFKVSTPNYNGTVIVTFQDNSLYSVSFRDLEFKILGITGAEKALDAVKDFVENGEVWV